MSGTQTVKVHVCLWRPILCSIPVVIIAISASWRLPMIKFAISSPRISEMFGVYISAIGGKVVSQRALFMVETPEDVGTY